MKGWHEHTYGERIAAHYDEYYDGLFDSEGAARTLAGLAAGGPVLELGIGTGRVALPLKALGVEVEGVDASQEMVEQLRSKPGGADIKVHVGDFARPAVDGPYTLAFVVFNTFFALVTQEDQIECFKSMARLLEPGGLFVIEAFVPDPRRFDDNQRVQANWVTLDEASLEVSRHDPVHQTVESQMVILSGAGTRMHPIRLRYAWPSELDLMARLAGMDLRERWGGWKGEPFTSAGRSHVSIYEKAQ